MLIDRRAVRDFLDRDLNSYLWMKKLGRATIERELAQLRMPPEFHTQPWLHQLVCFWIGLCERRFLFLLDMGLGKSKILADLMRHTQRERKLWGALIVVPRKINVDSWVDDLAKHQPNLEPWRIDCVDIEEKRERILNPRGDVTIIDNQGLALALSTKGKVYKGRKWTTGLIPDEKAVSRLCNQYNWLGVDEIHKYGNHQSHWYDLMDRISERMDFAYGATGTLFGRAVENLWAPFQLIDRGETFGETLGLFRAAFFRQKMNPWSGVQFVFDDKMDATLHSFLQNKSIRYDENEVPEVDLPKRVERERKVDMADEQKEHYNRALEGLINASGTLAALDAAWLRMRQIVSGYLVWKDEHGEHHRYFRENPKLEDLESVVEGLREGEKLVVCYVYTLTGRMICERLKEMKVGHEWLYGGSKDPGACRRRFMKDPKCRVFVMNDEAGGTGNDGLQDVARYLYFYETPSSPIARMQVLKRVHRPGQKKRAFIFDAVMKRSVDRGILDGIKENTDLYQRVVNGKARYKNLFLG